MADTRMKIFTKDQIDAETSGVIIIKSTGGMRRRLSALAELGIFGSTVEEVAERLVCRELQEMEGFPK